MEIGKMATLLHVIIALCFGVSIILCWSGVWYPCLYLAVIIIVLYMCLGATKNGKLTTSVQFAERLHSLKKLSTVEE